MAISKGHTFTANEEVDHSKLNNLVDNATISDGAITSGKIAGSAVTSAKIAAGAISNTAISSTAGISLSKLESATDANPRVLIVGSDSKPAYQDVSGDATIDATGALTIADGVVTGSKLAADSVGTSEIQSNAVGTAEIQDNAVQTSNVGDGVITAAKLASGVLPPDSSRTVFGSSGTWTRPSWITVVHVTVIGAGAGGGGHSCALAQSGGIVESFLDVSADTTVAVTVGGGGSAGTSNSGRSPYVAAGNGGNSNFGAYLQGNGGVISTGTHSQGAGTTPRDAYPQAGVSVGTQARDTAARKITHATQIAEDYYGAVGLNHASAMDGAGSAGNAGAVIIIAIG